MDINAAIALGRQCLATSLMIAAPILGIGLLVGVVVALFQAVTSLQEQTLTMVPKIMAIAGALFVLLPWILDQILSFARLLIGNLGRFGAGP